MIAYIISAIIYFIPDYAPGCATDYAPVCATDYAPGCATDYAPGCAPGCSTPIKCL